MRKPNAWHHAIVTHLHATDGPLSVAEIWQRMKDSGFSHASKLPRSTLGARIAELVQLRKLSRVGPATYQLAQESSREVSS